MTNTDLLRKSSGIVVTGFITSVRGNLIKGSYPCPAVDQPVLICTKSKQVRARITSFIGNQVTITPYESVPGLKPGLQIISNQHNITHMLSTHVGGVYNAWGELVLPSIEPNRLPKLKHSKIELGRFSKPIGKRHPIRDIAKTGIMAIDGFLTLGRGQRLVLFAEPGVGKSTLLLSIAAKSDFDLVIFALIGERGREVAELHEKVNTSDASKKSIIVASTSDESPNLRAEAAHTATAFAEAAASQGLHVLLAFDSLTRYIRSIRDVALSTGEQAIRRGYPASIFESVPKLIERSGNFGSGSITSIYTMLTTSQIDEDPFVEEVKGLTDGHIFLNSGLSERGIYPAIDIRTSLSRLHTSFWDEKFLLLQRKVKKEYAAALDKKDLLLLSHQDEELRKTEKIITAVENFLSDTDSSYDMVHLGVKITQLHQNITELTDYDKI